MLFFFSKIICQMLERILDINIFKTEAYEL